MRVSVALCTYNGSAHLPAQWASIVAQTRQPDELVVCDDGSTDGTLELLERFAREAAFAVRVERNAARLGPALNFGRATELCQGDVIVWCDQDDVWHPRKLERIAAVFEREPEVEMVFSDARVVDAELRPMGYGQWDSAGFSRTERRAARAGRLFEVLLRHNVVTGATMAFTARWRKLMLPIEPACVHDEWAALLISAAGVCRMIEEPLIDYRQHGGQQIGGPRNTLRRQFTTAKRMGAAFFERELRKYEAALERLHGCGVDVSAERLEALRDRIEHTRRRLRMRRSGRSWRGVLGETWRGGYHRFGYGWKSIAQDLFL